MDADEVLTWVQQLKPIANGLGISMAAGRRVVAAERQRVRRHQDDATAVLVEW